MNFICHRVNKVKELEQIPAEYGVEIDLRDDLTGRVYVAHNPFEDGENFEEYLKKYHHGTLICNIKSERIEHEVTRLLKKYHITDYFFLDSTFPMIVLLSNMGERKIALRYSEFEKMDTIEAMAGKVDWVWVDCFTKIPVSLKEMDKLKSLGYKACFVSPELQGRPEDVDQYIVQLLRDGIKFDAVCTKYYMIKKWKDYEEKIMRQA
jgi:hypothetical protein